MAAAMRRTDARVSRASDTLPKDLASFDEFWPVYLGEHRCPRCRALHYVAATAAITIVTTAVCTGRWSLLLAAPLAAYSLAWLGHFCFEGNRPATWGYPWWSLRAEYRMFWLAITGQLKTQLPPE